MCFTGVRGHAPPEKSKAWNGAFWRIQKPILVKIFGGGGYWREGAAPSGSATDGLHNSFGLIIYGSELTSIAVDDKGIVQFDHKLLRFF